MSILANKNIKRAVKTKKFRLEHLEARHMLAADPIINEFMASNNSTLDDGYGNSSDWIEIYNQGDSAIDLNGWYLTDDQTNLTKWQFPDLTVSKLDPSEYLIVFASNNLPDQLDPSGNLHAAFKLGAGGEYVALVMPDGTTIASEFNLGGVDFPQQFTDVSYGLGQESTITTLVASGPIGSGGNEANVLLPNIADDNNYQDNWNGSDEAGFLASGGLGGTLGGTPWTTGFGTGVGYDTDGDYAGRIETDISALQNLNTSTYIRIPFTVSTLDGISTLNLNMDFDDGFIAYLNGVEVQRQFFAGTPDWDSAADTTNHEADGFESFDISAHLSELVVGSNLLAIQGLNRTLDSTDFLILPELIATFTTGATTTGYLPAPTPGSVNSDAVVGFVGDTSFDVDRGFYDTAFDVTITSATPGATIVYTTNGSEPTLTNGTQVLPADQATAPVAIVNISGTTTLRAAAFKDGFQPTNVDTQTYIFTADVITQSAINQTVVNDPAYSSTIQDDLKAIPTLSLVLDDADIFGTNGIYSNPQNRGLAWERPLSIEFFDPNSSEEFQIDAGIRIHGADARNHVKKPFRLYFRGDYGATKLRYPLFDSTDVEEFDRLILRGGGHEAWTSPHSVQDQSATYIRDQFLRDTEIAMGQVSASGRFVHLYINGEYWGMYNLHERPDDEFQESHFGGDAADYDVLNSNASVVDGNKDAWTAVMNIANASVTAGVTTNADYQALQQKINLDSLIDDMIVRIWSGDIDWLRSDNELGSTGNRNKNWYAAINRVDGKFHFFVWDGELSMGKNHTSNRNEFLNLSDVDINDSPGRLYTALRQNTEFQLLFADRLHKHFFNDGVMTPAANKARWDALADSIRDAVVGESARWGGGQETRDLLWQSEVDWVANTFITGRTATVLQQFNDIDLYPDLAAPTFDQQHGGEFSGTLNLTMSAPAGQIYYTLDGSDPRDPTNGLPTTLATVYSVSIPLSSSTTVNARVLDGGGNWSALNSAEFISLMPSDLRVTEIMFNPQDANGSETATDNDQYEFIELQNTSTTDPFDLNGIRFDAGVEFDFSTSAVTSLAPGEFVLVVRDTAAFIERYGAGLPIAGEFVNTGLSNNGESLRLLGAVGETLQEFEYDNNWYPLTEGLGFSLTIVNSLADINTWVDNTSWKPSSVIDGTPGIVDPNTAPAPGSVIINEVLTNSTGLEGDRIELLNTTGGTINVGDWYLSDDPNHLQMYQIGGNTEILSGGYLVFDENTSFGFAFNLSELGDELFLTAYDALNNPIGFQTSVSFDASAENISFGQQTKSTGTNDFVAMIAQTFGATNNSTLPVVGPVVINEIMYNPTSGGSEFIELLNLSGANVSLGDGWQISDAISYQFPAGAEIAAGGYALLVQGTDGGDAVAEAAAFRAANSVPAVVPIFIYTSANHGSLSNGGEKIVLEKPADGATGADLNGDTVVGLADLLILKKNFGTTGNATLAQGDLNNDNDVNSADLALLLTQYGSTSVVQSAFIVQDTVDYNDGTNDPENWPTQADGLGFALSKVNPTDYGNDVAVWSASLVGGTPGALNMNLDITPPSTPTNVSLTTVSSSQVDLNWDIASDPESGIDHYNIYRNTVLIATSVTNSYSDNSVVTGVNFSYEVSAVNGDAIESGKSTPIVSVTIVGLELVEVVDEFTVTMIYSEDIDPLTASQSANYQIDNGATINSIILDGDIRTITLTTSALTLDVTYTVTVNNVLASGGNEIGPDTEVAFVNASAPTSIVWDFEGPTGTLHDFTELAIGTFPGSGTAFSGNPVSVTQVNDESNTQGSWFVRSDWHTTNGKHGDNPTGIIESDAFILGANATFDFLIAGGNHPWNVADDPDNLAGLSQVTAINLEREVSPGDWDVLFTATSTNTTALSPVNWDATSFAGENVRLRMYDTWTGGWGHITVDNIVYAALPLTGDLTPPSIPMNIATTVISNSQVDLTWNASVDLESGVASYNVFRDNVFVGNTVTTSYSDTSLPGIGSYSYEVSAVNGDTFESSHSVAENALLLGVSSASANSDNLVSISFSGAITTLSAENTANYLIDGGITVIAASLQPDNQTVILTTSTLTLSQSYTVTAASIVATSSETILLSDNQAVFTYSSIPSSAIAHFTFDTVSSNYGEEVGNAITNITEFGPAPTISATSKFGAGSLDTTASNYLQTNNWDLGGSFTVAVWVQPRNINANWTGFLSKNLGNNTFWLGQNGEGGQDGEIRFGNYFAGTGETALDSYQAPGPNASLQDNVWSHVAAVWNDATDTQQIYVNGTLVAESVRAGQNQAITNSAMNIGRSSCNCNFDGLLDEAWIFSEPLDLTQITNLMNNNDINVSAPPAAAAALTVTIGETLNSNAISQGHTVDQVIAVLLDENTSDNLTEEQEDVLPIRKAHSQRYVESVDQVYTTTLSPASHRTNTNSLRRVRRGNRMQAKDQILIDQI